MGLRYIVKPTFRGSQHPRSPGKFRILYIGHICGCKYFLYMEDYEALELIGEGSTRKVYAINSKLCVKVAKNENGVV